MEIKIERMSETSSKEKLSTLSTAQSVEQLASVISDWITKERSLIIASQRNDEDVFLDGVSIIFRDGDSDVAEFSVANQWLFPAIPQLQYILPEVLSNDLKAGDSHEDGEKFFKNREKKLGGKFNENLNENEFSLVNGIAIACSYAVIGQGETYFSGADESFLKEAKVNSHETDRIISVASVQANSAGFMKLEKFFCLKP